MTSNQINNRRNRIEAAKNDETARSNRANERIKHRDIDWRKSVGERQVKAQEDRNTADFVNSALSYVVPHADAVVGQTGGILKAVNDPSWYNLDRQLVQDVANLPFGKPLGTATEPIGRNNNTSSVVSQPQRAWPGIMTLQYGPTIASTPDQQILTLCARQLYAWVRHANSGSANYEATDLMKYILAVTSAYSYFSYCARLYSLALDAKRENFYYNKTLFNAALGVPNAYDNYGWGTQLAQFRAWLNQYAIKLRAFAIPNDMAIMRRWDFLNTGIFKDQEHKRSQVYMFVPEYFYYYWDQEGALIPWSISSILFAEDAGLTTITEFGDALINALLVSEDIGIISGDIQKAFSDSQLYMVASIPENYHIEAAYSPEVLQQIQSASVVGRNIAYANASGFTPGALFNVVASPKLSPYSIQMCKLVGGGTQASTANVTLYNLPTTQPSELMSALNQLNEYNTDEYEITAIEQPLVTYDTQDTATNITINGQRLDRTYAYLQLAKDSPTPDDVMVASRLTALGYGFDDAENCMEVTTCGTEVVFTCRIWCLGANTGATASSGISKDFYIEMNDGMSVYDTEFIAADVDTANKYIAMYNYLRFFEWAPLIRVYCTSMTTIVNSHLVGSSYGQEDGSPNIMHNACLENWVVVYPQQLGSMHQVATMSLLGVPLVGSSRANSRRR